MKKFIYLFTLFALCISITIAHAASPTYDDNPPPSYIWGNGGLNPQTSGTPNKNGEQRIEDSIYNVNVTVGSISVDTGNIENSTNAINSKVSDIKSDVSDIKIDISSISSNIGELLANGGGGGSASIDTSSIENKLIATFTSSIYPYTTSNKSVAEMLKLIYQEYESITRTTEFNTLSMIYSTISNMYSMPQDVSAIQGDTSEIKNDLRYLSNRHTTGRLFTERLKPLMPNAVQQVNVINPDYEIPVSGPQPDFRVFVELRAIDPDAEFYIGFDMNLDDTNGRPVKGRILLNIDANQEIYIYHTNATDLEIQQTEGWR